MSPSIEELIRHSKIYLTDLNSSRLKRAYQFANKAHEGQLRKGGDPYIVHPLSTAIILTELHVDEDTLIAALLHDVPEDTEYNLEDIEKTFGKKITFLVEGITKLSKVHYRHNMEERQVESLKKLFIHSAKDIRVILIKLADRLHNMMTIQAIPKPEKRIRIAKETLEIYVPIANILGIWELKSQLEDLCFKTLYPEEFAHIEKKVMERSSKLSETLKKTINQIKKILSMNGVKSFKIEGRKKTYYSIYQKMFRKGKNFEEIYDLIGLRIIVPDVGSCYQVLGILHQNFTPKLGRLKDYIAIPKSNGYQSIHTTIFGVDGHLTELQIRTHEMQIESEYGVAANYFYNKSKGKNKGQSKWVQKILDIQRDMKSNEDFIEELKLDLFEDRIFAFTPKGDVIDLPRGATVLDFAYHIHSEIGNHANSATVNKKEMPLDAVLHTGDVIEVVLSESVGPSISSLEIVRTNLAKNRIREFLKNQSRSILQDQGGKLLTHKLKLFGHCGAEEVSADQKKAVEKMYDKSWKNILIDVGSGLIDPRDIIKVVFSMKELIGEEISPVNLKAYSHVIAPPKIHKIHFLVEGVNRVGLLRDVTIELASLNINLLKMNIYTTENADKSILDFFAEIRDLKHFESAVNAMKKVPGVLKISKINEEVRGQA